MFGFIRGVLSALWQSWRHPIRSGLPVPPLDRIATQTWGDSDCGPCAATNVLAALGLPTNIAIARSKLLKTYKEGTSTEALMDYLNASGACASLVYIQPGGMFEVVERATRGGSYCIPLVKGPRPDLGHFILCNGTEFDGVRVVDSLPGPLSHVYFMPHKHFEGAVLRVDRKPFGGSAVVILVRGRK